MCRRLKTSFTVGVFFALAFALAFGANMRAQQKFDKQDLDHSRQMLFDAYDSVKKHYYDTKFHGLDWDARYHQFDAQINTASTLGDSFSIIADFLDGLKDSHTYFIPPARASKIDYGYRFQMVGDKAFIIRVRPGTDAEIKLQAGEQITAIDETRLTRNTAWQLKYLLTALSPQPQTEVFIRDPDGRSHPVDVLAKDKAAKKVLEVPNPENGIDMWQYIRDAESEDHTVRQRWVEMDDVMIWKMPEFDLPDAEVDRVFGIARKHKSLVLDLRGNPGGSVDTLDRMLENLFDHDVKVGDLSGHGNVRPQIAKAFAQNVFAGKLIVLIDSDSASAAELFARVIQLEHRGTVIGDHSSGSVMEARGYTLAQGTDKKIYYAFSITDADIIMEDGKSLEHVGVTPDEISLPTGDDIAKGRDPVLAHAVQVAGGKLDAAAAGKLFPFEWIPF
ncbi:MAG TPA: S41 family peptidase [Candidatus Acidoferrales bacterium]